MKNDKRKIIFIVLIITLLIIIGGITIRCFRKDEQSDKLQKQVSQENQGGQESLEENDGDTEKIEIPIENEEKVETPKKEEINTIKENTGKTGDEDLYEIQKGYDNTKIVTIKSSIKYKTAFSGMIKNKAPKINELDKIVQENHPKYAGIWIYESDRENILNMLKEITDSEYKIDENGYLKIVNKNNQNENDKKIEKAIKGEMLYIIRNSSTCYIVDEVTGEVLDYCFENMDKYQTYEYFEDNDKMIIFVTENSKKQMSTKEILESVIDLL